MDYTVILLLYILATLCILFDLFKSSIPNSITVLFFLLGNIYHIPTFKISYYFGVLLVAVVSFILYQCQCFGAGDAKFFIATSTIVELDNTFNILLLTVLLSVPIGLVYQFFYLRAKDIKSILHINIILFQLNVRPTYNFKKFPLMLSVYPSLIAWFFYTN